MTEDPAQTPEGARPEGGTQQDDATAAPAPGDPPASATGDGPRATGDTPDPPVSAEGEAAVALGADESSDGQPDMSDTNVPAAAGVAPLRHSPTALLTWGTVVLVLVIVVVLVVVKLTRSTPTSTTDVATTPSPAPTSVVQAVTKIPGSVYDTVGVTSPDAVVAAPAPLSGQPDLSYGGKPGVLFVGEEFCPYCSAERWALVAALSRFGKWSALDVVNSSATEAFPSTQGFTFVGARYSSNFLGTALVEHYGDAKNGAGTAYAVLQPLSASERDVLRRYDKSTLTSGDGLLPFIDIDNRAVVIGGNFSPSILEDLTTSQVASALTDVKDPVTQAIVAAANYLSAELCAADGGQPVAVCTSKGVTAAVTAMSPAPQSSTAQPSTAQPSTAQS